jgi:hypothetical protein
MTLLWCRTRQQASADSSDGGECPCPPPPDEPKEEDPRFSHITVLPLSVWREHIRPLLEFWEAAGLRVVCKALKASVEEWPMRLGEQPDRDWPDRRLNDVAPEVLVAALTCFPTTESVRVSFDFPPSPAETPRLVEFLKGHGGTLKRFEAVDFEAQYFLEAAVQAGALPNLTDFDLSLKDRDHRQVLLEGMLERLEDVRITVTPNEDDPHDCFAPLEHLRRLRHLRRLSLEWSAKDVVVSPRFIPPSLKSLTLSIRPLAALERLLLELPCMLQESGASLEDITVIDQGYGRDLTINKCGAALGQVFRLCSSTLKMVELVGERILGSAGIREWSSGLTSCCATLEVLHIPLSALSALLATSPCFLRLTELVLKGEPEDANFFTLPVWDVMANGRLPALVTLRIKAHQLPLDFLEGEGAGDGERRLTRAFEAVAGTLEHLTLYASPGEDRSEHASYELGAAIGKLCRLRDLRIDISSDARAYQAFARGLATSGGCPEPFVMAPGVVETNFHLLTSVPSLIVRSVRELCINGRGCTEEEALLLCCGVVQVGGSKCALGLHLRDPEWERLTPSVRECMWAILSSGGFEADTR